MSKEPVPVAMIGVGGFGSFTLRALHRGDGLRLVGVADKDSSLAAQAQAFGVPFFTDNRSLLAQAKPRAVFLAVPPPAAGELIAACAERGIHVWKETPLARNLDEAAAFVRRMEKAKLKFAVGTQRRFAVGYRRAWELREKLGQIFLARSHYLFNWGPNLSWRGDKATAGGGTLLELGYHCIDLLNWTLGLPAEVYGGAVTRKLEKVSREEKAQAPHDTDDTAAAILRYADGLMASVVTTRFSGPESEALTLHGRRGSLAAKMDSCTLRDAEGNVLDRATERATELTAFRRQAAAFAAAVADDSPCYECSARENLLNLAVIEAIYLSDRTSQPENPQRRLKTAGFTPEDCLINRPPAKA